MNKVRRRPVDALFGEKESTRGPSYVVEPPQPVTTISKPSPIHSRYPPPVEKLSEQPAVEAEPEDTSTSYDQSSDFIFTPEAPYSEEPVYQPEPMVPDDEPETPRVPVQAPPKPIEPENEFARLPEMIERLYDQVSTELFDSPVVTDYCLKILMQAREAYSRRDYAAAEFYVETVRAKLKRSARSVESSRSLKMWLIWGWEFLTLGGSGIVIALTYIPNLALFGVPVGGDLAVLMRALGWGGIGGVIGALYNLPWFIQFREYDPAYNMNYVARPLQGMLIGGILFLLSQAGVLAGNTVIPGLGLVSEGDISLGPVFLYLIAALAGFKQEYVYEFFDNLLKMVFRSPQVPNELRIPTPPGGIRQ